MPVRLTSFHWRCPAPNLGRRGRPVATRHRNTPRTAQARTACRAPGMRARPVGHHPPRTVLRRMIPPAVALFLCMPGRPRKHAGVRDGIGHSACELLVFRIDDLSRSGARQPPSPAHASLGLDRPCPADSGWVPSWPWIGTALPPGGGFATTRVVRRGFPHKGHSIVLDGGVPGRRKQHPRSKRCMYDDRLDAKTGRLPAGLTWML